LIKLQKLRAQPGDPQYHKLAVLVPSLAYLEPVANLHDYRPAEVYFHKPRGDPGVYSAVKVVPHEKPLVQNFDALEFLTRNMFVTRANLWHKALAYDPYPTFTFSLLPLSD
jgi:16S rRNA A1518/A1519 N6-dimethyltransferase RsmA/KsgA/DIM1 with predicted DNA glycosylase/AP lyase activity